MNADQKECSKCAEIIKLKASACRHCGQKFSSSEIEKLVAVTSYLQDAGYLDEGEQARLSDFDVDEIDEDEDEGAAALQRRLAALDNATIIARLGDLGVVIKPERRNLSELSKSQLNRLEADLRAVKDTHPAFALTVAEEQNLWLREVSRFAKDRGIVFSKNPSGSLHRMPTRDERIPEQLQPTANLASGCTTMIGLLLILGCIAVAGGAIMSMFG